MTKRELMKYAKAHAEQIGEVLESVSYAIDHGALAREDQQFRVAWLYLKRAQEMFLRVSKHAPCIGRTEEQ